MRRATEADAEAVARIEAAARRLLANAGVDLASLLVPDVVAESTGWSFAFVAEVDGSVVASARLTELSDELVSLDQVSTDPTHAGRGVGRRLLEEVIAACREAGYTAVCGTTFRDVAFNGPFYARLGGVEDPDPHPVMVRRRRVERQVGLDGLGARLVLRLPL